VGLAMAENITKIAFTYTTLANDKDLVQKIVVIIQKEKISQVIIGIPMYMEMSKTEKEAKKLGQRLIEKRPQLKVEYYNEMFTTKMAQDNLKTQGIKKIQQYDDQEAARIILQSWLDQ
jgi:putative Holliday junction resolvase